MMKVAEDPDPFWEVELSGHEGGSFPFNEHDDDDDDCDAVDSRFLLYKLPSSTYHQKVKDRHLHLASLPLSDGIMSPLGAEAWYGSALLTALLYQSAENKPIGDQDDKGNENQHAHPGQDALHSVLRTAVSGRSINKNDSHEVSFRALELGSGAVGLSGFALAALLAECRHLGEGIESDNHHDPSRGGEPITYEVILSDNDDGVLQQLRLNLDKNSNFLSHGRLTHVSVSGLDWGNDAIMQNPLCQNDEPPLRLVFGSELVYSNATAEACASCVQALFKKYAKLLVVIVQITDRPGWDEFLSILDQNQDLQVMCEQPISYQYHNVASEMIQLGGTMSRFDYGACYITSKS